LKLFWPNFASREIMTKEVLKAEKREKKEKREGSIPAILYGKGVENQMLWLNEKEFGKVFAETGESTLLDLEIAGEKNKRAVLIHDFQRHPLTEKYIHVDLFQVDMKEKIETEIELVFTGVAPAVKELGGTLVENIDKLPVRCLPGDLVSSIEVNVSALKTFEDHIYVKDLNIPEGMEVLVEDDLVVALVTPPRTAAEMEALNEEPEADISQVEGMEEEAEKEESSETGGEKSSGEEKQEESK